MAIAGYNALVKMTGTTTAFVASGFTDGGTGVTWQITDSAKRVFDPAVALSFFDNAVPIVAADIVTVDYLFGQVTFTGVKAGPITASGSYFPLISMAQARSAELSLKRDILDTTVFGDAAHANMYGLLAWSGSLETLDLLATDLDSGGGTLKLYELLTTPISRLIEIDWDGTGLLKFRGWVNFESLDSKASVTDLIVNSISFTGTARTSVDGYSVSISFGS